MFIRQNLGDQTEFCLSDQHIDHWWKVLLLECLIKFCMDFFCLDKATAEMKIRDTPLRRKDDFDLESDQESN
jgi:hypothetical protein